MKNLQIIIIDDDVEMKTRPLYEELEDTYGKENILWFETPKNGLAYIKENNNIRRIILLDYDFGTTQFNGLSIFKELHELSSLFYIIIYTAKNIGDIPQKELKYCINNHLMALMDKTDGYEAILNEVEQGIKNLNNRVDCILEEWILRHEKFKRETPYIKDETGKIYNLNDVLHEIRQDTPFGKKMSSNIISTAISFLQKDIKK